MSTYKRFSSLLKNYQSKEFYRSDISNLSNLYDVTRKSLIYPLGRLPRYQLIMKDLLRYTELEHPDLRHCPHAWKHLRLCLRQQHLLDLQSAILMNLIIKNSNAGAGSGSVVMTGSRHSFSNLQPQSFA